MKAWWFEPKGGKLGYEDGRKPEAGVTHKIKGETTICRNGLHGSVRILSALYYASSSIVWRVEIEDDIKDGTDKICGQRRTYLYRVDAEKALRQFARDCALSVLDKWDAPDVVKEYFEKGKEELRDTAWEEQNKRLEEMIKDLKK